MYRRSCEYIWKLDKNSSFVLIALFAKRPVIWFKYLPLYSSEYVPLSHAFSNSTPIFSSVISSKQRATLRHVLVVPMLDNGEKNVTTFDLNVSSLLKVFTMKSATCCVVNLLGTRI